MMSRSNYGFGTRLRDLDIDQAVAKVTAALKAEGFGVLTTIDIRTTLKAKLDVEFRPYVILGACNPKLAHRALAHEAHMGLLLPCNVVVQQAPDDATAIEVSMIDPSSMVTLVGKDAPEVAQVAQEADAGLRRVVEALQGS